MALVGACLLLACGAEEPEPEIVRPVRAMQVAEAGAFDQRWFPGRAQATQQADIAFEVSGRLVQRPVQVGDPRKDWTSGEIDLQLRRLSRSAQPSTPRN